MSEIEGLEKLKKLDIKDIRKATNLTPARIEDVLNKNFDSMERVRAVGFVRILEREFNVDLSEWIKEYDEHHKIENVKIDDSAITSLPSQSNVLNEYPENQKNLNEAKNFLKEQENAKKHKSFPFVASEDSKQKEAKAIEKRAKADEERRELITPADFIDPSLSEESKEKIKRDELKEEGIDSKDLPKSTDFDLVESKIEETREEQKALKRAKRDETHRETITSADFIDPNLPKDEIERIKKDEIVEEGIDKAPVKTSTYIPRENRTRTKRKDLQGVKLEYSNSSGGNKKVGKVVGIIILIIIIVVIVVVIALFVAFENRKEAKLRNANLQMEHLSTTKAPPSQALASTQDTSMGLATNAAATTANAQEGATNADVDKITFNSSEPLWLSYIDLTTKAKDEKLLNAPFTLDVSHDTVFHFGHTNFELSVNGSNVILDNPTPSNPARYLFSMKDGFKKITIKEFNKLTQQ
ncbi:hypothetical protein BKH43_07180 [Helicobacter sp. 13S00401-1]|uniref:hypothetical protein n=1 Tax=Helicobacter sp. 13S00401-1 TaxID=1905758 RepID=UPI000BA5536C|nr:hypothetical protein [Helicobacter sp. 13S00401-1]PAF49300.1 hypothetical protein BKH43_07180 [Helicobacter sp. 13S00401-1]